MPHDVTQMAAKAGPTRRRFVHGGAALASIALAAPSIVRPAAAQDKVLNWLTYSGHSADEVIGPFVQETGIKIQAKNTPTARRCSP